MPATSWRQPWPPMRIVIALLLNVFSCVAFSQEPPPVYKALLTHCEGIQNTLQCARAIEQAQAKGNSARYFEREKLVLRIRTGKKVVTLRDRSNGNGDDALYSYLAYLPELQLHVQFYEGDVYAIVHQKSGELAHVDGFPLISPDRKRFVTISNGGESGYYPNSIEVWRVQNGLMRSEYRYEPSVQVWGPKAAAWTDSATIAIEGECNAEIAGAAKCPSLKASFRGGRWKLIWPGENK
jgi:hypothetical protein